MRPGYFLSAEAAGLAGSDLVSDFAAGLASVAVSDFGPLGSGCRSGRSRSHTSRCL